MSDCTCTTGPREPVQDYHHRHDPPCPLAAPTATKWRAVYAAYTPPERWIVERIDEHGELQVVEALGNATYTEQEARAVARYLNRA